MFICLTHLLLLVFLLLLVLLHLVDMIRSGNLRLAADARWTCSHGRVFFFDHVDRMDRVFRSFLNSACSMNRDMKGLLVFFVY